MKKLRDSINKIVDVRKLVFRLWVSMWIVLGILLAMKYLFNIWYPIVADNNFYISVCNFFDNNIIAKNIVLTLMYMINANLFILISLKKKKLGLKLFAIFNLMFLTIYPCKALNSTIGNLLEISTVIAIPIMYHLKVKTSRKLWCILYPIIIYALLNIWQLNIFLVRDLSLYELSSYNFVIIYIMQIDYYLFLIITYTGVNYMGLCGIGWLWCKTETELKAIKEQELSKTEPDKKLIDEIDRALDAVRA